MNRLQNDFLQIDIKSVGAELCSIKSTQNNFQFMWDANHEIWPNHAPNLFPIVGMLKGGHFNFMGNAFKLPKHGFVRNNVDFQITESNNKSITLKLCSDTESLKIFPFEFEYSVIYQLVDNILHVTYEVKNINATTMYFSLGAHPAFKCPVFTNELYSDYSLVFDKQETSKTHLLDPGTGLLTDKTKTIFDTPCTIGLRHDLFDNDALIFKDLKSRKVTLQSNIHNEILTVHFDNFPFLGIWAKPNANYVCIEPWLGIADHMDTDQEFTEKEGVLQLKAGHTFSATYSIEIHKPHLV